jgi:hypothetical protein
MAEATLQQMCRSGRDACLVAGHHRPRMTTDRRTELRDVSRLPVGDLDERDRTARDSIGDHTGAAVMREGRMPSVWRVTGTPGLSVAAPAEPGGRRIPGPEWGRPSHGGPKGPTANKVTVLMCLISPIRTHTPGVRAAVRHHTC